jgi:hypothetical protein
MGADDLPVVRFGVRSAERVDIGITGALSAAPSDAESLAAALADAASVHNGHSSSDDAGVVVVQIERPMRGAPTDGHV